MLLSMPEEHLIKISQRVLFLLGWEEPKSSCYARRTPYKDKLAREFCFYWAGKSQNLHVMPEEHLIKIS